MLEILIGIGRSPVVRAGCLFQARPIDAVRRVWLDAVDFTEEII